MSVAKSNRSHRNNIAAAGAHHAKPPFVISFLNLPPDVHASILSYLSIATLLRSRSVSKLWKAVTSSQALWSLIARRSLSDRQLFHGRIRMELGWEWICLAHLIRFPAPPVFDAQHPFTSVCSRDHSTYIGDWLHGKRHGYGMTEANGILMIGDWSEDTPHGEMIKIFPRGERWEGTYIGGDFVRGTKFYANGDKYTGELKDFQMDGKGEYIWSNGDSYSGAWRRHQKHGFGVFVWSDGRKYEGFFQAGQFHGTGKFTWPDGSVYDGHWENGLRIGSGEMIWKSGEKYEGEWNADQHDLLEHVMPWDGFFLLDTNGRSARVRDFMQQTRDAAAAGEGAAEKRAKNRPSPKRAAAAANGHAQSSAEDADGKVEEENEDVAEDEVESEGPKKQKKIRAIGSRRRRSSSSKNAADSSSDAEAAAQQQQFRSLRPRRQSSALSPDGKKPSKKKSRRSSGL